MSTLTLDMIREAMAKVTPIPPSEIHVGSPLRFREAMRRRGGLIEGREDRMTFGGVPVVFHPAVPEHIAVVIEGGQVKSIINLDDDTNDSNADGD